MTNKQNPTNTATESVAPIVFPVNANGMVTAKSIASAASMNEKSARRRIRNMTDDRAGKGGRWEFDQAAANTIVARLLTTDGRKVTTFSFKD